jgi:hypothetical protein
MLLELLNEVPAGAASTLNWALETYCFEVYTSSSAGSHQLRFQ